MIGTIDYCGQGASIWPYTCHFIITKCINLNIGTKVLVNENCTLYSSSIFSGNNLRCTVFNNLSEVQNYRV